MPHMINLLLDPDRPLHAGLTLNRGSRAVGRRSNPPCAQRGGCDTLLLAVRRLDSGGSRGRQPAAVRGKSSGLAQRSQPWLCRCRGPCVSHWLAFSRSLAAAPAGSHGGQHVWSPLGQSPDQRAVTKLLRVGGRLTHVSASGRFSWTPRGVLDARLSLLQHCCLTAYCQQLRCRYQHSLGSCSTCAPPRQLDTRQLTGPGFRGQHRDQPRLQPGRKPDVPSPPHDWPRTAGGAGMCMQPPSFLSPSTHAPLECGSSKSINPAEQPLRSEELTIAPPTGAGSFPALAPASRCGAPRHRHFDAPLPRQVRASDTSMRAGSATSTLHRLLIFRELFNTPAAREGTMLFLEIVRIMLRMIFTCARAEVVSAQRLHHR